MGKAQIDLCPNTGDSEGVCCVNVPERLLLEFVMLYSKVFCACPNFSRLPLILLGTLLLTCQLGIAQVNEQYPQTQANDLIGGNMGLPSSTADNSLINPDAITPPLPDPKLSPAEAAELVRKKVGGQVMSVNTQQHDSGVVYGVKVLNDGRMRVIHVDGQTGRLLN